MLVVANENPFHMKEQRIEAKCDIQSLPLQFIPLLTYTRGPGHTPHMPSLLCCRGRADMAILRFTSLYIFVEVCGTRCPLIEVAHYVLYRRPSLKKSGHFR
jgi:hypothetical protein